MYITIRKRKPRKKNRWGWTLYDDNGNRLCNSAKTFRSKDACVEAVREIWPPTVCTQGFIRRKRKEGDEWDD